jgi:predicted DNA repair protein MutK
VSQGLLALLDDVALIARQAAVSLDDLPTQVAKASAKTAGVVIDDAAVTPRYVVGIAAQRELPVVMRIAMGSLRNKLLVLLPVALVLSVFLPQAITPLLMIGGGFLGYEGALKLLEMFGLVQPHGPAAAPVEKHAGAGGEGEAAGGAQASEDATVKGAVRTDLILSAEIMAISLATLPVAAPLFNKAAVLAVIGLFLTGAVYGAVAIIVKADDVGLALAQNRRGGAAGAALRAIGRGLVRVMPGFLKLLATVGTFAMLWVGGEVIIHGLAALGWHAPEETVHDVTEAADHLAGGIAGWAAKTIAGMIVGVAFGLVVFGLKDAVILPVLNRLRGRPAAH